MATYAPPENEDDLLLELREKFRKKYVEPPSPKLDKFDERDVNRIWNDDKYALSFLHWKKGVIKDAVEMMAQVLEWRKERGMTDLSVDSIGLPYMERGCCYVHGRAVDGTRVFCLIARLQTKDEKDPMRKVFMFWLERLQRNEPGKHVTFVLDTYKTAMSNVELGTIKFIIDAFSTYFPDLLERIIILDMPWIMNAVWKIVKQWMSEEQRSRVFFCSRKDLHELIAVDQRTKDMAGTSDWVFSFPPFPDELSQNQDFKNDPMNFKIEEPKTPVTPSPPPEELQQNGDVGHDQINNNKDATEAPVKLKKIIPEKKMPIVEGEGRSTPDVVPTIPVRSMQNGTSSSLLETVLPDQSQLQHHSTEGRMEQSTKLPPNVSFKSIAPSGDDAASPATTKSKMDAGLDEIVLRNMLCMSPVSELSFTLEGDRLESFINIRNPNQMTDEKDQQVYVAYKVKTTSPERYHVKPSVGVVAPGDSVRIRIYLGTGHESSMMRDRFLLLYKPIPAEEDNSYSHGELIKFWKKYSDKSSHFEHRVRVKVEASPMASGQATERKSSEPDFKVGTPPVTPVSSFQDGVIPGKGVEYTQLQQQLALLSNKISRLESDSRWMRRRMRHAMGLFFVVIILMLLILYEITMVSYSLSSDDQGSCSRVSKSA